jgi:hypothetical protein
VRYSEQGAAMNGTGEEIDTQPLPLHEIPAQNSE